MMLDCIATDSPAGLCARCTHVKLIRSDRGSVFYQCLRSFSDPNFPKYPRLPVRACPGFEPAPDETKRTQTRVI